MTNLEWVRSGTGQIKAKGKLGTYTISFGPDKVWHTHLKRHGDGPMVHRLIESHDDQTTLMRRAEHYDQG